jgi:hypothetical protein
MIVGKGPGDVKAAARGRGLRWSKSHCNTKDLKTLSHGMP